MKPFIHLLCMVCMAQLAHAQVTHFGTGSGTGGNLNSFFGYYAGNANTSGSYNTFLGHTAGQKNTSGRMNTFIGADAGRNSVTASYNVFIGTGSGFNNTGNLNTFMGHSAGNKNTSGVGNTYIGHYTGFFGTTGGGNTYLGQGAGHRNTTGGGNVFLGYQAGYNEMGSNKLYIDNSNTATPLIYGDFAANKLEINGFLRSGLINVAPHNGPIGEGGEIKLEGYGTSYTGWHIDNYDGNLRMFRENGNSGDIFIFNKQGKVGIGTHHPGSFKLAVEGKIGAREIQVTNVNPWPDYVFAKDYDLPSLSEVEAYIQQNQHLPNVPSAKVVAKEGIELGKMNATLLRKVEELTLYMIQQNKINAQQAQIIEQLQKQVEALKKAQK